MHVVQSTDHVYIYSLKIRHNNYYIIIILIHFILKLFTNLVVFICSYMSLYTYIVIVDIINFAPPCAVML